MTTRQDFFNVIFFDSDGKPVTQRDHKIASDVRAFDKKPRKYDVWVPANGGMWKWSVEGDITFHACNHRMA